MARRPPSYFKMPSLLFILGVVITKQETIVGRWPPRPVLHVPNYVLQSIVSKAIHSPPSLDLWSLARARRGGESRASAARGRGFCWRTWHGDHRPTLKCQPPLYTWRSYYKTENRVQVKTLWYAKQKTVSERICFDTVVHIACGFMV